MFTKLFKRSEAPEPTPAPAPGKPVVPPPDPAPWQAKLQAAMGNDEALLALATEAPILQVKEAAIEALTSEDALKRAEREFRTHDRRVYRTAKMRYEAAVAQREARHSAHGLITVAIGLANEAVVPANRLVELDHQWQALPQNHLTAESVTEYKTITDAIAARIRERGDAQLATKRWAVEAQSATSALQTYLTTVASGDGTMEELAVIQQRAWTALDVANSLDTAAAGHDVANVKADLGHAIVTGEAGRTRLEFLLALADKSPRDAKLLDEQWKALPVVENNAAARALNDHFNEWHHGVKSKREADVAEKRAQSKTENAAAKQAFGESIGVLLAKAEATLAEGHVAEATEHVNAIDVLQTKSKLGGLEKTLSTRLDTIKAEIGRLKGWQHWGGGRVREDLVDEAEALAKEIANPKLAVKVHGDAIEKLRNRWKELDKLGGATSQTLWQRFDGALKTAYLPVGAGLDKQKAQRNENLAARNKLVVDLGEVKWSAEEPDFRLLARSLEHFQTEWRKLGPVEHTVPRKAQESLLARMRTGMARLEEPLNEARRVEQLKREKLIERAKAIAADAQGRDTVTKVRDLQAEWQKQAKGLPLARQAENALWSAFKSATDAVFTARDAAHTARDAEFKGNQTARQELIGKLTALTADTPPPELKRAIADVDAAWRRAGEAPRAVAAKLEGQFRAARDAAQALIGSGAKRTWHAVCDSLMQKVALCEELEGGKASVEDVTARWPAEPTLTPVWAKALEARRTSASASTTTPNSPTGAEFEEEYEEEEDEDDENVVESTLLKLEAALNIESPPAFAGARRDLKLQAMKRAIEGRGSATVTRAEIEGWIAEVISERTLDTASTSRWRSIFAQIREHPLK
jgi:DNA repair protein SbcC/Rad50